MSISHIKPGAVNNFLHDDDAPVPGSPALRHTPTITLAGFFDEEEVDYKRLENGKFLISAPGREDFKISVSQDGRWIDFRTGQYGDIRALTKLLDTVSFGHEDILLGERDVAAEDEGRAIKIEISQHVWKTSLYLDDPRNRVHSDRVFAYLTSRGLDPSRYARILKAGEMHPNADHAQYMAGARTVMYAPMREFREISGIQRTYLDEKGRKIRATDDCSDRKMLGTPGVLDLAAQGPVTPLGKGEPISFIGEGFETVASACEATGRSGVVCFSTNTMKKFAESISGTRSRIRSTIGVLVDRDDSEAGQKYSAAACGIIREGGHFDAVYLLPKSGEKCDWNDILTESGREGVASQMVVAYEWAARNEFDAPIWGEKQPVETEDEDESQVTWTRSPNPIPLAKTLDVDEVSDQVGSTLRSVFGEYSEYVERYIARRTEQVRRASINKEIISNNEMCQQDYEERLRESQSINLTNEMFGLGSEPVPEPERPDLTPRVKFETPLPKLGTFTNVGIQNTVGSSKSQKLKEAIDLVDPRGGSLVLVRTHDECDDYEAHGYTHVRGRSPWDDLENHSKAPDHACFNFEKIEEATSKNHIAAATVCRDCKFGRKLALDAGGSREGEAKAWFTLYNIPESEYVKLPACHYLAYREGLKHAPNLVGPYGTYSDDLATKNFEISERNVDFPRIVLIDESPEFVKPLELSSVDLSGYIEECDRIEKKIRSEDIEENQPDVETEEWVLRAVGYPHPDGSYSAQSVQQKRIKKVRPIFDALEAAHVAEFKKLLEIIESGGDEDGSIMRRRNSLYKEMITDRYFGEEIIDPENQKIISYLKDAKKIFATMIQQIADASKAGVASVALSDDIMEFVSEFDIAYKAGKSAIWEQYRNTVEGTSIPLRAAHAISKSCRIRNVRISGGAVIVMQPSPLLERIADLKGPTVIMDATLPSETRAMIEAGGGRVVDLVARQNIMVRQAPYRLHARAGYKGEIGMRRSVAQYKRAIMDFKSKYEGDIAFIGYSQVTKKIETFAAEQGIKIGYHGKDDIAHNKYKHHNLLIEGSTLLSTDAVALAYDQARTIALMAGCSDVQWPAFDQDIAKGHILTTGEHDVECKGWLPTNPQIRAWYLRTYTNRMIQMIGRARGASWRGDRPLVVEILGGLPMVGLEREGIAVEYFVENQRSKIGYAIDRAMDAVSRCMQAGAALIASDVEISYRKIVGWLQDHDMKKVGYANYEKWVKKFGAKVDMTFEIHFIQCLSLLGGFGYSMQYRSSIFRDEKMQKDAWQVYGFTSKIMDKHFTVDDNDDDEMISYQKQRRLAWEVASKIYIEWLDTLSPYKLDRL